MMGCGAEGTARERRYFRFFDRSPSIEALGPQRLLLGAGDQTLVLERPETRRRVFVPTPRALTGTWRLESIARYEQGSAVATAGLSAMPGHLVISDHTLRHTACPALRTRYRIGDAGRLIAAGEMPRDLVARCPALHPESLYPGQPGAEAVLALLYASPLTETTGENGLVLSTDELGLLLRREDRATGACPPCDILAMRPACTPRRHRSLVRCGRGRDTPGASSRFVSIGAWTRCVPCRGDAVASVDDSAAPLV